MDAVVLMVGLASDHRIYDIEVMPDIPANELANAIAAAFNWPGTYDIEIGSTNQRLLSTQTLADIGAWDGSHLKLVPSKRTPLQTNPVSSIQENPSPSSHRPLQIPAEDHPSQEAPVISEWRSLTPNDPKKKVENKTESPVKKWSIPDTPTSDDSENKN